MGETCIVNGQVYIGRRFEEKTLCLSGGTLRVLEISRETRTANAIGDLNGAIDDMPRWCVTIGMNEIYNARKVRLGVFRDWHRAVLRHTAYGEVSAHFPATLMQTHPDALIRTTEFVACLPD